MMRLLFAVATVVSTAATLLSDIGCQCALVKGNATTPSAAASVTAGCSTKLDWNGAQTRWCLTDETAGVAAPCGTLQTGFGYVDSCAVAGITADIAGTPVYTGQNLTVNWTTTNFLPDELLRLTFNGRTLATNVSSVAGLFTGRVTTTGTNQPVLVASLSSPAVSANTSLLTVLQSALTAVNATYNGTSIAGTTQVCDDRVVTISWAGVGDATGNATVTVKTNGGFGGTRIVGTPAWTLATAVNYTIPRSFVPFGGGGGGGTTYIAAISLQGASGLYTLNSASFSLVAAPSPSPTPSGTPTPSKTGVTLSNTPTNTPTPTQTPTASLSVGSTASNTPSVTPTYSTTPSVTASSSLTPSTTVTATPSQTPAASVNYGAIAAAAAEESSKNTSALIGAVIGGIVGFILVSVAAVRVYQRYEMRQRRERRLRTARSRGTDSNVADVYGVNPSMYYASRQLPERQPRPLPPQLRPQDRVRR